MNWAKPVDRWIGPSEEEVQTMLSFLGLDSLDALVERAIPRNLLSSLRTELPKPIDEPAALTQLAGYAAMNKSVRALVGYGFHDCITPAPIQRHVLENPGWYTPYTPYQAEISQGRLECLFYFQTVICELTGMDIANASLLDGASAAAEGMMLCARLAAAQDRSRILVAETCHPHQIEVVRTRAEAQGFVMEVVPLERLEVKKDVFCVWVSLPDNLGRLHDFSELISLSHSAGSKVMVSADLLALTLVKPPGEMGADVVVGTCQRFGQPLGYGGPHAAFLATRDVFKRQMPGRLVGLSKDARGKPAFRLALAAREQHIRREKATSNICTAQALMACVAALYAIYHGPDGLKKIAKRIHNLAIRLAGELEKSGYKILNRPFFDTVLVGVGGKEFQERILGNAEQHGYILRPVGDDKVLIALDERSSLDEVKLILNFFGVGEGFDEKLCSESIQIPDLLRRRSEFLQQPVFNKYHSETALMRFIHKLESKDYSLRSGMIPLGSCTMKLSPSAAMFPLSWEQWQRVHPCVPPKFAQGYWRLIEDLGRWLCEITGMDAITFQPNAGSQGEYTGLLIIRKYHSHRGQPRRKVCLIPVSAHGTNPASAAMAGLKVVAVSCDSRGNVDVDELKRKVEEYSAELACIMLTYPSTHGVFEERIQEIVKVVHEAGGLVYLDGANLNAMAGLVRPGDIGADVCHVNLHKTFGIPHGGGGPGLGPVAVREFLKPYLPWHPFLPEDAGRRATAVGPVAATPFGAPWLLLIPWVYIRCLGYEGLRRSSQVALLAANYMIRKLSPFYKTVFTNSAGWVAHEGIIDLRDLGVVTAEDVAKRLIDYGLHAPTLSWPVPNTFMIEPTESEPLEEIDRFCRAMIEIYKEIQEIVCGKADAKNNVLKNAPHPVELLAEEFWPFPYSREKAVFPLPELRVWKFWPACARVDNVYGDRNPVCRCL